MQSCPQNRIAPVQNTALLIYSPRWGLKPFLSAELSLESSLLILIARLAEESEHILLVALNAGLVEGVDTEHISAYGASLLEEVNHVAEALLSSVIKLENNVGNAALSMSEDSALICASVYNRHVLVCEEVKTVKVCSVVFKEEVLLGLLQSGI